MDQEKVYKKHLTDLVTAVERYLEEKDKVMSDVSSARTFLQRGKDLARLSNALEYRKDQAKHFGLGLPLAKSAKRPK